MKMKSVMQHDFSKVPQALIPRSSFNRSHGYKTTFNAGYLIPFLWDEVLPGDTFNVRFTAFCRFATLLFPLMDNMYLDTFFFFVPNRLLWSNWQKFNGEQANPGDSTSYTVPTMTATAGTGYLETSIFDYFGLPTKVPGYTHISLPLRAHNLIYNEWFRDQNLQNSVTVRLTDGSDVPGDFALLRRGKRHDYFTSALPWPQKGTAVSLPLGTTAPIIGLAGKDDNTFPNASTGYHDSAGTADPAGTWSNVVTSGGSSNFIIKGNATTKVPQVFADLSSAAAATINQLRQAFQVQKMYERDARGGTRYCEILQAHFGVTDPSAAVLQRPQYLGGGSTPINIHVVTQNSGTGQTGQTLPLASLAGFGTGAVINNGFSKSFTEHGQLIGLLSVRADLTYQAGLNRAWSRSTRFDYYWPALSHIGEQTILNKEIWTVGTGGATDDSVFGYQERYAEYRYFPSQITGLFRTNATGSLDAWHLSQDFAGLPTLGATFIVENPPTTRVKATSGDPDFILDGMVQMNCARPMPVYGVPGLIDHF